ncbi:MAG: hemerythrin domain-containing protein [Cucumibacter sp.]
MIEHDLLVNVLSGIAFLDDATRPSARRLAGLTETQRLPGRQLAQIHEHFRDNMKVLRELIAGAAAGEVGAEDLRARAEAVPMLMNYRRFGNLCGRHCQIINMHHAIEDQAIFPQLRRQIVALRLVVERLVAEHEIVHELLLRLVAALQALARQPGPDSLAAVNEVYGALERVLLSHFFYEETQIGDAVGYYGIGE